MARLVSWSGPQLFQSSDEQSASVQVFSKHQNPTFRTIAFSLMGKVIKPPWIGPILHQAIDSIPAGWKIGDQVIEFALVVDNVGAVSSRVFLREGQVIKTEKRYTAGIR